MTEDRSTGGLALPAVPPAQSVNPTRILTVLGFGGTENLKSPTLRIPPRLRGGGCQFGAVADLERDFLRPHAPIYWEWEDEIDYSFDLDPDVEQRIRQLARETGVVEDLPADWTLPDLDPSPLSDFEEELF